MISLLRTTVVIFMLILGPSIALAQAGQQGVFNCNRNGTTAASAGSTGPIGGPFVPVADYAVELNTGLLVYKECVLRVIANSQRRAATTAIDSTVLRQLSSGREGKPFYSQSFGRENLKVSDETYRDLLQDSAFLAPFDDALENEVRAAVTTGYIAARTPNSEFACDLQSGLRETLAGNPADFWESLDALVYDPACSPFSAALLAEDEFEYQAAYNIYENTEMLAWGDGWYPVEHKDEDGDRVVDTPANIIAESGITHTGSSYEQLQMVDDIGEMVDSLYAGISTQVLQGNSSLAGGTPGGLTALVQGSAGQQSYLDRVAQNAAQEYLGTTNNAAVSILQTALQTENAYNTAMGALASLYTSTINNLRSMERQCYETIIPSAVCQPGTLQNGRCTALSGGTLTLSSNTAFSQPIVDARIRPNATTVANNINSSNVIIQRIQSLISSLAGTPTQAVQQAALTQLAAIQPHSQTDVSAAQSALTGTQPTMTTLINETRSAWGDSMTPSIGWCNVNNPAVVTAWSSCWGGNPSACLTP